LGEGGGYAEIQQTRSTKSAQNGRLSLVRYATSRGARDIHRALGAEGLEMNQSEPWSMAMLAEIYMLRLEAAARAAKETARFIPIALPVVKAPLPSIRESSSAKPGRVSMGLGPLTIGSGPLTAGS
jgi:hypothetical protein